MCPITSVHSALMSLAQRPKICSTFRCRCLHLLFAFLISALDWNLLELFCRYLDIPLQRMNWVIIRFWHEADCRAYFLASTPKIHIRYLGFTEKFDSLDTFFSDLPYLFKCILCSAVLYLLVILYSFSNIKLDNNLIYMIFKSMYH